MLKKGVPDPGCASAADKLRLRLAPPEHFNLFNVKML
jgi:hypothetical protein